MEHTRKKMSELLIRIYKTKRNEIEKKCQDLMAVIPWLVLSLLLLLLPLLRFINCPNKNIFKFTFKTHWQQTTDIHNSWQLVIDNFRFYYFLDFFFFVSWLSLFLSFIRVQMMFHQKSTDGRIDLIFINCHWPSTHLSVAGWGDYKEISNFF